MSLPAPRRSREVRTTSPRRPAPALLLLCAAALAACQEGMVDVGDPANGGDPCTAATPISLGQSLEGSLSEGDCARGDIWTDRWSLELDAPTPVRIDLSSTAFDAYLELRASNGVVLAENDDAGSLDSRIIETLPAGSYVIVARSLGPAQSGSYRLSVGIGPDCTPVGRVEVGERVAGRIDSSHCPFEWGGLTESWDLELTRQSRLRIEVASPDFDEGLVVRDDRGHVVWAADGLGPLGIARADVELPAGSWTVSAVSIFEVPGAYELSVDVQPPCTPGASLSLDETFAGSLDENDCLMHGWAPADSLVLDLADGTPVEIVVKSGDVAPIFTVLDHRGLEVTWGAQDFNPTTGQPTGIARTAVGLDAGTYAIFVASDGYPSPFGDYQITVHEVVCDEAVEIGPDTTVVGTLDTGDCLRGGGAYHDRYALVVPADATLRIDLESSAFDSYLVLRDDAGEVVATDDDGGVGLNSRIERTLGAGTWVIEASALQPGATGAYTLTVGPVAPSPTAPASAEPSTTSSKTVDAPAASGFESRRHDALREAIARAWGRAGKIRPLP